MVLLCLLAQVNATEDSDRIAALRVQVPNFNLGQERTDGNDIGFLALPLGHPLNAKRIGTQDDLMMHIQITLLVLVNVNLKIAMITLCSSCNNN